MKKLIFLITLVILLFTTPTSAEIIVLKSGNKVQAKIVEQTKEKVVVDFQGTALTFYPDEISQIQTDSGEKLSEFSSLEVDNLKTIKIVYKVIEKMLDSKNKTVAEHKGQRVVYIDKIHNKKREETTLTSTYGSSASLNTHLIEISDGKKIYTFFPEKKGTPVLYREFSSNGMPVWLNEMPMPSNKQYLKEDNILGKKCQMYDAGYSKIEWICEGLKLKEQIKIENTFKLTEATDVQENIDIDDNLFALPTGSQILSEKTVLEEQGKAMLKPIAEVKASLEKGEQAVQASQKMSPGEKRQLIVSTNDSIAKSTLRSLSTASETFSTANNGRYPESTNELTQAKPPYLATDYCNQDLAGFHYACQMNAQGYTFTASPIKAGETGTEVFTISTGGVLEP